MIYFDYSATTFPSEKVIKDFTYAAKNYIGNPNSSHRLGKLAKARIDDATINIANILNVKNRNIIYTSGASEANNLAIKGVCALGRGKHIITTPLEHSSVISPLSRLMQNGYDVSFVNLNGDGTVNMDHLKSLMRDDTVLVSIVGVDSELGIKQNIEEVGLFLTNYPNCYFHVDATQLIGKQKIDFSYVDLFSFSAHKFFGIKGIGALVKKENVKLIPQIDGGHSTTVYRSGTPALELIVSLESALEDAYQDFDKKLDYINEISTDLKTFLSTFDNIKINNTSRSIDQIINFSLENASDMIDYLNECGVYVSSKSACSSGDTLSKSIMTLYNDEKRANSTVRISLSYVTTKKEIEEFKKIFKACYNRLGANYENN